jgi:BirA family biotin operon repressor/biotin-[acetyl-CoA-carboxylase] ligase
MDSTHEQNVTDVPQIITLESVDSTNAELHRMCDQGPVAAWTVVTAFHQSAGRGRQGRNWQSDPGAGLWVSVLVDLADCPQPQWLPLIAGLSLCNATRKFTESDVALKWPNDVIVGGRKLAGILTEALPKTTRNEAGRYIVGMGLNFAPDVYPGAAGLRELIPVGAVLDRDEVLAEVIGSLRHLIGEWRADHWSTESIRAQYLRRCLSIGAELEITEPGAPRWSGTGMSIDSAGHLVVREHDTQIDRTVVAADVIHASIAPCTPKNS